MNAVRSGSAIPGRRLIDNGSACLADDFVLGIRAARNTDGADNRTMLDQWNAAARRDDVIESQQIVEAHELNAVLENFRWPPEGCGGSRFVLRNLNGCEHRTIHSLEGNQVPAGICD